MRIEALSHLRGSTIDRWLARACLALAALALALGAAL